MPDKEITPQARIAVAAAFAYAGTPSKGWNERLAEGTLRAAAAMNGRMAQVAQDVLDCDVFKAVYRGYTLEETSTRLKVTLESETTAKSEQESDGTEMIRTERTDNQMGKLMKRRLDELAPGSTILVFKLVEHMEGRGIKDKVRVLKHFEVLSTTSQDSRSSVTTPASGMAPVIAAGASPPGAPAAPSPNRIAERLAGLTGRQAAAVAKSARAAGVPLDGSDARLGNIIDDIVEGWQ